MAIHLYVTYSSKRVTPPPSSEVRERSKRNALIGDVAGSALFALIGLFLLLQGKGVALKIVGGACCIVGAANLTGVAIIRAKQPPPTEEELRQMYERECKTAVDCLGYMAKGMVMGMATYSMNPESAFEGYHRMLLSYPMQARDLGYNELAEKMESKNKELQLVYDNVIADRKSKGLGRHSYTNNIGFLLDGVRTGGARQFGDDYPLPDFHLDLSSKSSEG